MKDETNTKFAKMSTKFVQMDGRMVFMQWQLGLILNLISGIGGVSF